MGAYPPRKRVQEAARKTTGQVLPRGSHASTSDIDTQAERARKNGIGLRTQKKLDWLARCRPDLLKLVAGGVLSADLAYCQARELPGCGDMAQRIRRLWEWASDAEKEQIVDWVIEAIRRES